MTRGILNTRMLGLALLVALLVGVALSASPVQAQDEAAAEAVPSHGISMHGDLKYPADFPHLDYVNPDAQKGGDITLGAVTGAYNSFNPYILEGDAFDTSYGGGRRFFETLTEQAYDEAFSEYCLLCETITVPDDRSWVEFKLREEARWHDGTPVTADDIVFSHGIITEKGHPYYQSYWGSIVEAIKLDDLNVRFNFEEAEEQNRELPLIAGQMPIFQQAYWADKEFDVPTLDVPVSSGPYKIVDVDPGNSFTFERDPEYWGNDLPLNKGRFNFDRITIDYYSDATVALEAFKAGDFDWRYENSSKQWATDYEFPAAEQGFVTKEMIPNKSVNGMQGFALNQRVAPFDDPIVREALAYAFDFEWSNKNLFYDQYTRTKSYWDNSELSNVGGEATGDVLAYLEPHRDLLPEETFTTTYEPPSTGGTEEGLRANIAKGLELMEQAGWTVNDELQLVNEAGEQMAFEFTLSSQAWERIVQPYIANLEKMGIAAAMSLVDPSQYEVVLENFDYDVIVVNRGMSPSPGNEQRNYWTCESADTPGAQNYWGVCNAALDVLVENVVQAESRDDLISATRALDRALLWQHLGVPHWHIGSDRVAYWNLVDRPETIPDYNLDFNTWFYTSEQAESVLAAKAGELAAGDAVTETGEITTTEEMTDTTEAGPTAEEGDGGGLLGPLGLGLIVLVAIVAIIWFARRGSQS